MTRRMASNLARLAHRLYKATVSPWLGEVCRFQPSCSDYAVAAIERHGALKGCFLALWRVIRCNPLCRGGDDPVP